MIDNNTSPLAILVLSCDKYSDLWDDFFNLKERFWPDCPYPCYLATDTLEYNRKGVQLIHFGNIRTWSICAREALKQIREPYIALFLEDAFIYKMIDSSIIDDDLQFAIEQKADFLTLERNRMQKSLTAKDQLAPHIWRIDRHRKYGIDTSAAIWEKSFLICALEKEDCNAWQFEVNYCEESETEEGLQGNIFFDDRQPFNISPIEIVRLGKINPDAIKFYKKLDYNINTSKRAVMSYYQKTFINMKMILCEIPVLSTFLKTFSRMFGVKYFS